MAYAPTRQLYFCTNEDYGDRFSVRDYVQLTPRHKSYAGPIFRAAPTVAQCLSLHRFALRSVHVYRTTSAIRGFSPKDEAHVHLTGERLLGPSAKLTRVCVLDSKLVTQVLWNSERCFRLTGLGYTAEMRVAIMAHAFSVLPAMTSNSWWQEVIAVHAHVLLQGNSPEEWLVHQSRKAEVYSADISRTLERHSG